MNEPSNGVPQALLPHIHLVSTYRYPILSNVSLDTVVEYLLQAPKIAREVSSMNWMFLDAPTDGTVMLCWQPLNQLATRFASDGYVWADPEQAFSQEHRGYIAEMYIHRSGYHPPHESIATHCRRRYRLTPLPNSNPNIAPCDPSLWIVHYACADAANQFPASRIQVNIQVQQMMSQRRFLQQHGQLVRKEFMLNDRANWPTINLPGGQMPQYGQQQGYPNNLISQLNRNQQQAFIQDSGGHHPVGPAPKRPRQTPPTQRPNSSTSIAAAAIAHDTTVEEDEETARGDLMDFLTPRDISTMRYTQHHEWMEEIFSSAYATGQIMPVDLGLGRKGELEDLTQGFFEAPTSGTPRSTDNSQPPRNRSLEVEKAEEFTKRAIEKITAMNTEMEKMKLQHAKRMRKLTNGSVLRNAEHKLRQAGMDLSKIEPEHLGQDGQLHVPTDINTTAVAVRQQARIEEIANEVEKALGRRIEVVQDLKCVQRGGLEEKAPPETYNQMKWQDRQSTTSLDGDSSSFSKHTQNGAEASLQRPGISTSHLTSTTMGDTSIPSPLGMSNPDSPFTSLLAAPAGTDSVLSDPQNGTSASNLHTGDSNDWVMVDKQPEDPTATTTDLLSHLPPFSTDPNHSAQTQTQTQDQNQSILQDPSSTSLPSFRTDPLASVAPDQDEPFNTNDFVVDDGVDFGDLADTAGEGMEEYGDGGNVDTGIMEMEEDGQVDLGMEDSAFGDAFHHTEVEAQEGREEGGVE